MEKASLITVLMPAYNDEQFIAVSIESVLAQTYTHFELLIIDDGSTDQTASIIKQYSDTRIRYVKNQKNLGLTKSLNIGIDLAKGEYIARHDSDDLMEPTRLEKQMEFLLSNPDVDIVGAFYEEIDCHNRKIRKVFWPVGYQDNLFNVLIGNNPVTTMLVRTNLLKKLKFNEQVIQAQDFDFYLRAYAAGYRSDNIPNILNYIRIHQKQISNKKSKSQHENHNQAFYRFYKNITSKLIDFNKIELYEDVLVWKAQKIDSKNNRVILGIFHDLCIGLSKVRKRDFALKKKILKQIIYGYETKFSFIFFLSIISASIQYKYPLSTVLKSYLKLVIKNFQLSAVNKSKG